MPHWLLQVLNIGFFVFHTALIFVNVFGWLHPKTRPFTRITQALTLFSWLVMGAFYGAGYCICTDWHWQVRSALGVTDDPGSYLQLLVRMISGWTPPESLVNPVAAGVFGVAILGCIALSVMDFRRRKQAIPLRPTP